MRVLLSSVGTRGDVQPIVALAIELRALDHAVRLCVPPNFVTWVQGLGFEALPVGVQMRQQAPSASGSSAPITEEQLRRMRESMPDLISDQFDVLAAAADGCDIILGANAHQYAARSIAEKRRIPYVTALYAPVALPSPDHAPPPAPGSAWQEGSAEANMQRWAQSVDAWNARALSRVNHNRARLGLAPIDNVLHYNITPRPWLAVDPILAPLPNTPGFEVFETGAWIIDDRSPLAPELEVFLGAGEAPVYVGFGSMPLTEGIGRAVADGVRGVGRRALVSRGWGSLSVEDSASDCWMIDEANHQALLPRTSAIVHHGGAGTTAAAARAGVPQVVVPMYGDQFYWASRVRALGIGTSIAAPLTAASLAGALRLAMETEVRERCGDLARRLRGSNGVATAAQRLSRAGAS